MARLLVGALALVLSGACGVRASEGRPNVLLVVADTLRADHVGAYGYPVPTTPGLDALAAEGVRFASYHSTSSWTRPAFATLLTGLYPRTAGIYEERFDRLQEDVTSIAEIARDAGYTTICVNSNPNVDPYFGFQQGFEHFLESGRVWPWMERRVEGEVIDQGERNWSLPDARETTDRALAALAVVDQDPWFAMVVYIDPHVPYRPPRRHLRAVQPSTSAAYDGEVRYVDAEVTRLLGGLRARGRMVDTLVVFTSDHGEGLGDYRGIPKSDKHGETLYDAITHVPLILHHPSLEPRVVEELVGAVDLMPTLLDLMGLETPAALPGRSLASLAREGRRPADLPDHVVAETDWKVTNRVSVRTDRWRYVRNDDARLLQEEGAHEGRGLGAEYRRLLSGPIEELYLRAEGFERWPDNRAGEGGAALEELRDLLLRWERATPAVPPANRDPGDAMTLRDGTVATAGGDGASGPDPELERSLRSLGYLGDED